MKISDVIHLGDKIDMQLTYQLERQKKGEDIEVKTYKSRVVELVSDKNIEILMPTENGKMVLFQTGLRCEMVLYTRKGMYKVNGIARERKKQDQFYILVMELLSLPVKFQRREFFRISYVSDLKYYEVGDKVTELDTTEELFVMVHNPENKLKALTGLIQDISGGGIRFVSTKLHEQGQYLVVTVRLTNDAIDENFYLLCRIVSSETMQGETNKFTNRAKFIYKDLKDRETIVRFVFEEERRIRKKVNG